MWRIIIGQMAQLETPKTASRKKARRTAKRSVGRPVASGLDRFRAFLRTGGQGPNSHVILLGIETFDSPDLLRSVARGLPYSAFERLVANTSFASEDALVLVNIPSRTLTRRKREGRFHEDESDRLVRASRLFGRALSLFEGDRDAAKQWLSAPQRALGGAVPFVLARTEVGALEVERLIGRLEQGVFA
jgi:putative toxin-antitoxin system antitoxin component (TIGR02293 family)